MKKECPVLLPHFCSQEPPGLPPNSSTPHATLATACKWCRDVAPTQTRDSVLLLLSTHSAEKNPNSNSENLWPNRLIYMKKLFSRKDRVKRQRAEIDGQEQPYSEIQTLRVLPGLNGVCTLTALCKEAVIALGRKAKSRRAELARYGLAALLCSTHWWQSQSWEGTMYSLMLTWKRQSEIETQSNLNPPFPQKTIPLLRQCGLTSTTSQHLHTWSSKSIFFCLSRKLLSYNHPPQLLGSSHL